MDWLVVIMAAIALMGILIVWFLHRGRVRLWSIGMVLLGLITGLFLYSQAQVFSNWRSVLLAAFGLIFLTAPAYLLLIRHLRRQEGRTCAEGEPTIAAASREPITVPEWEASQFTAVANEHSLPEIHRGQGGQAVEDKDSAALRSCSLAAPDTPEFQTEAADAKLIKTGVAQTAADRQALAKAQTPETSKKTSVHPSFTLGRTHTSAAYSHSIIGKEGLQASHIRPVFPQIASEPAEKVDALSAVPPEAEQASASKLIPVPAPAPESIPVLASEPAFIPASEPDSGLEPEPESELELEPEPEPEPEPESELEPETESETEQPAFALSLAQAMARLNSFVAARQYQEARKQVFTILQSGYDPTPEEKQRLLLIMRHLKERERRADGNT